MPENQAKYQDRLKSLRTHIQKEGYDGFVLPRTDEFQGEFLAEYAERLAWLTGFTGSAGASIILKDRAVVMSDGRYTIQLRQQVDATLYQYEDSTKTTIGEWLKDNASDGMRIAYDVWLHTPKQIDAINKTIEERDITLVPIRRNCVDQIWENQPDRPKAPVTLFPNEVAGQSAEGKCGIIADEIHDKECVACLITMSDSIAWLLNIRGNDIPHSPLALSYALLYANGSVDWFIDKEKIDKTIISKIGGAVNVFPVSKIEKRLSSLSGDIWMDYDTVPQWFVETCMRHNVNIVYKSDPCAFPKSIKSNAEQDAIRKAHIEDGIAVSKFLKWIEEEGSKADKQSSSTLSELSVERKLEQFRRETSNYLKASFPTIAGYKENGAIIHYRATKETNKDITGNGLLLIDSGGQYKWGTTDITRTVPIGQPTQEMRENYTRVLQGHIAVATARFPKGTIGKEIDALARKPLQEAGLDYAHGTGHGVGCYLCVHEVAANISPRGECALVPGMLLSNEPGYYKEGEYGIRLENLIFVQEDERDNALYFETITLAPFADNMIVWDMMSEAERLWLDQYHKKVK